MGMAALDFAVMSTASCRPLMNNDLQSAFAHAHERDYRQGRTFVPTDTRHNTLDGGPT